MNRVGKPEQPGAKMRPRPDASHGGAPPPVRFATSPADVDVELRPPAERAGRPALPSDHLPTRRPSVELCGKVTITRVPHPGADSTERSAPTAAARSCMIISPHPWSFAGCSHADGSNPQPSSAMVRRLTSLVVARTHGWSHRLSARSARSSGRRQRADLLLAVPKRRCDRSLSGLRSSRECLTSVVKTCR
jgi:hypothetical protein